MKDSHSTSSPRSTPALDRRQWLRFATATGLAAVGGAQPRFAKAEIYEEGDEQCRVGQPAVQLGELTEATLADFISVSQTLTGEKALSRRLAAEYLERFAWLWDPSKSGVTPNPGYFAKLKALIAKHQSLGDASPDEKAAQLMNDPSVSDAAQQVIYIWYVSAFFIEPPENKPGANPGTFKSGKTWIYGATHQYGQALLWKVVRAHAPAMPGGPPRYWANSPAPSA